MTSPIAKALALAAGTIKTLKQLRHESAGWQVYSDDGSKHLGGPYPTKDAAVERLRQVEDHKTQKDATSVASPLGIGSTFRKRPVPVRAMQLDRPMTVATLEGEMRGKPGDWLITGVEGEQYICDDTIFRATYEPAEPGAEAELVREQAPAQKDADGGALSSGDLADGGLLVPDQHVPKDLLRRFNGITVRVDRPKGFVQEGKGEDGVAWSRTYKNDYGEIPGTLGGDGDALDVFLGDDETAKEAHWVIQRKSDGTFDEYKMILGASSAEAAKAIYLDHVPEKFFGGMTNTTVEMVKALLGIHPVEMCTAIAKALAMDAIAKTLDDAEQSFKKSFSDRRADMFRDAHRAAVKEVLAGEALGAMAATISKSDERPVRFLPVEKADAPAEQRFILGVVLEPETVDAQGEIYSAAEIEATAHRWLAEYQNTDLQHKVLINPLVKIVESYIARADQTIGGQQVKAGTWLLAHRIVDDELWAAIKKGEFSGYSIKGLAQREPVTARDATSPA